MTGNSTPLAGSVRIRILRASDVEAMCAAYLRNREHLAPWEPLRAEEFFTVDGQMMSVQSKLSLFIAGSDVPWVLTDGEAIVGLMTLSGIVRGPFLSAHLGYWVDKDYNGRGIGSAAVAFAVGAARDDLGLHRLQAATLQHNAASQKILKRAGFAEIGVAPAYLNIAGGWQDHILFQRILY
ncbi:ribosomal-protein-alanine N-acetyltransferase [Arthrobacter ginsengisoli]|uniref:Ribosomal-protein-alanine N-acetyltransferase n=1 Tax=Arthrobacter ginsengisoli TaxID=1356565 RepID=A0ABU1UI44_9MICC|nr:GNAT family N-acetyltransferase [Arthrobacter ginsengisoli]MDR7084867.1 ribosomal-protein-alanine N-acetyltransferase [Arthrobacter ginsengisoli]